MDRYVIAGGLIIAAAAAIFAWGLCRAAARPMPTAPDHADDCPDFIEPAEDTEDAEWLLLMAEVDGDWLAWEQEVSA